MKFRMQHRFSALSTLASLILLTTGLTTISPFANAAAPNYEIRLIDIHDNDGSSVINYSPYTITGTSTGLRFIYTKGNGSNEFHGYMTAGHTFTVKYRILNGGSGVANQVVYLRVNPKDSAWYQGDGGATLSGVTSVPDFEHSSGCGFGGGDCAALKATSDANGYVTWTLTSTNIDSNAENRPTALNGTPAKKQPENYFVSAVLWPTFTATTSGLSDTSGTADLSADASTIVADVVNFHAIKQYVPQVIAGSTNATSTFESGDTSYSLTPFGGPNLSTPPIAVETTTASYAGSRSLSFVKIAGSQTWAGVTVITQPCSKKFSTTYSMKVYAPDTSSVLLKIEDAAGTAVEASATPSSGGSWQTLNWDFGTNGSYSASVNYTKLSIFPAFGAVGTGQTYYIDDLVYSTTEGTNDCPKPYVPPKALGLVSTGNITVTSDAVTCSIGTYKTDPTDAIFYLFINGQPVSGKSTSPKASWMSEWNFVPITYSTATLKDGASWKIQTVWNSGHSSTAQCLVKAYADRGLESSKTSIARIDKVGRLVRTSAVTDITMRLVEPAMTKTSGVPTNYVDFSYDPIQNNWAKYYGPNLGVFYKYFEVGSTFKVTYKVTNSKTGKALANRPVWLIVNKNYGGVQAASFTYTWNEEVSEALGHSTDLGETQIPGWTDADGMVTFTLTNTNSATQAEPKPAKLYEVQPTSVTPLFSTITLTARLGSDETHETKDIIWGHFTQK